MKFLIERPTLNAKVLSLCLKHRYVVEVNKLLPTKSITLFPDRIFGSPLHKHKEIVHEVISTGKIAIIKRHDGYTTKRYKVPDYAVRPFIIQDIELHCTILGIDKGLIVYYNEKREIVEAIDAVPGVPGMNRDIERNMVPIYQSMEKDPKIFGKIQKLGIGEGIVAMDAYVKKTVENYINQES